MSLAAKETLVKALCLLREERTRRVVEFRYEICTNAERSPSAVPRSLFADGVCEPLAEGRHRRFSKAMLFVHGNRLHVLL
jgi:hypothetical protein